MAESVDALVSNTSGAIRAGSTPALGTSSTKRRIAKSSKRDLAILLFTIFPFFFPDQIILHTFTSAERVLNVGRVLPLLARK